MGVINAGSNYRLIQKDLSTVFYMGMKSYPDKSMIPKLLKIVSPDQATRIRQLVPGTGAMPVFNGEISYDSPNQSYTKSTTEVEYALGIKLTKKFRRLDLYGAAQKYVESLAYSAKRRMEAVGAGVFNNAFTTETVADGLSLCNSSHTSDQVGGIATQSNAGSLELSSVSLEATRRAMLRFRGQRGEIVSSSPDVLLVSTENAEIAEEILRSTGKLDTANNNINFNKGKYRLIVWDQYLSDGSTVDGAYSPSRAPWFLIDSELLRRNAEFIEYNPIEFFFAGEFDTINSKHACYMSCATSVDDWKGIYGQNPS